MSNRRWLRAVLVVALVAIAALLASAALLSQLPLEQMSINLDGERVDVHGLSGPHAVALVCLGAVVLVSAIFLAAVALVLGLLAAVFGIALAAVAAAASLLLTLSPLLLIGWLIWRAARKPPAAIVVPAGSSAGAAP